MTRVAAQTPIIFQSPPGVIPLEDKSYQCQAAKRESGYCFIARYGAGEWIYAHATNMDDKMWKKGIATPTLEIEMIQKRLAEAERDYRERQS
jgi:hypothetical protein